MEHQSTAEKLAYQYIRALEAKDKQAILSILTDDFALEIPCNVSGTNDFSDSWQGIDKADANYELSFQLIEHVTYEALEVTPGRDDSVAFAEGLGVMMMANGRPYRNRYVFRFDVRDGKIRRIREYLNPVTSAVAFGLPLPQSESDGLANTFS